MNDKLVDLITDVLDFVDWDSVEALADYLIANGVVIQKQGEWVLVAGELGQLGSIYQCSLCGHAEYHYLTSFCGGCSARMKKHNDALAME